MWYPQPSLVKTIIQEGSTTTMGGWTSFVQQGIVLGKIKSVTTLLSYIENKYKSGVI